jgi:DNA-binding IclR family transcriptional regulator
MSQAAGRTIDLLEAIASSSRPLRLMELVASTGVDKSTATRLLRFLQERTLIRRDPDTKCYAVGPGLLSLSAIAMRSSDLPELAGPQLTALRDDTGETASLHLRVGRQRVCVAGAESRQDVRRVLSLGESVPLCVGPSGKVMLAFLPEPEIRLLTKAAVCGDPDVLRAQLEDIRRRGSMSVIGDRTMGVGAISVPIFRGQTPVASLTVAGPGSRWNLKAMKVIEPRMISAAARLSAALASSVAA